VTGLAHSSVSPAHSVTRTRLSGGRDRRWTCESCAGSRWWSRSVSSSSRVRLVS